MLPAGIYKIVENKIEENFFYNVIKIKDKYDIPNTVYGNTMNNVIRVWNHYAMNDTTTGVLYTGIKGSGKTLQASILCNIAIDNNLPIITVTEINCTIELINYLSTLKNCVIFLDEFSKNITYDLQNKMLTMLSDLNNTRKLFILTENSHTDINQYILDRPGRIRYHFDFDKLDISVLEDFCKDYRIDKVFYNDLITVYKKAKYFSFDQLQAIITEHMNYPNDTIENLLKIMNLHGLKGRKLVRIKKVYDVDTKEEYKYSFSSESTPDNFLNNNWNDIRVTIYRGEFPTSILIEGKQVLQDSEEKNEYYYTQDNIRIDFTYD